MKPISKTFEFSDGKTLKVRTDGLYEWCGVLLGQDECVALDAAILLNKHDGMGIRSSTAAGLFLMGYITLAYHNVHRSRNYEAFRELVDFVRRHWVWIKGS